MYFWGELIYTFLLKGNRGEGLSHQWEYLHVLQLIRICALRVAGHIGFVPTILNRKWVVVGCGLVGHGNILNVQAESVLYRGSLQQ